MANRDAKKIERTLKDFSLGAMSGGGGVALVDKLPEKGSVGALYKTPDGNIYSWFHEETQKEVEVPPTALEVGKTYELKEKILIKTFEDSINNALEDPNKRKQVDSIEAAIVNGNLTFDMMFQRDFESSGNSTYSVMFSHQVEADDQIRYFYNEGEEQADEYVHRQINGWTGPTEITVTQEWIDNLNEDWGDTFDINNLNFLFVGTTETVTVVNEGYVQLNEIVLDKSILEKQNFEIYLDDENYDYQLIYNTLVNGGNFVLKIPQYNSETATEPDSYTFEMCTSYDVYPSNHEAEIYFSNASVTINLINENQFIDTIKGQDLIVLAQEFGSDTATDNRLLISYLSHVLETMSTSSESLPDKALKEGLTISMFEGLIEYKLVENQASQLELPSYNLNEYQNFENDPSEPYTVWSYDHDQTNSINFIYGNGNLDVMYIGESDFSKINPTKDYNCDITVYFADGTSITVPMRKTFIYPEDGNDGFFVYAGE